MQGTPGILSGELPLCPEDRHPLHKQLHFSSANTDLILQRYLNASSWLEGKHLVSLLVQKVMFLHYVKKPCVRRNFSKPGCFKQCPKFLPREGSPNKTIHNYRESKGDGLV